MRKPQQQFGRALFYATLALTIAATVWMWWQSSGSLFATGTGSIIAIGRLAGLGAELTILLQLILIGRITFVEQLFGHDKMNKFHRWIGYSILLFFSTHPTLIILGYSRLNGVSIIDQYLDFVLHWDGILLSSCAMLIFLGVICISLPIIRKKLRYESWYFTHLLMYVAIGLAFDHQTNFADVSFGYALHYWYVLNFSVFGLFLFYRWARPFYRFWLHRFTIDQIVQETPTVFSIYIKGKGIENFNYRAGQFANITFLQNGMWFTHPFSFSTAPQSNFVRFSIKTSGDFTNKINQLKTGTKVIIDGPLGLFTQDQATAPKFLFLAGGIGITPIRALVEELAQRNNDLVLLYSNRTEKDIVLRKELEALQQDHNLTLIQFIEADTPGFEQGRIDGEKIQRLVPDFQEREVYICGPDGMMIALSKVLQKMGVPKRHIHFERFAL